MIKTASIIKNTPPWTRSFAEIALRGVLRLHHDYLLWSLPQEWGQECDPSLLRTGPGAAFADESTVCAAISQEFLASRAVSGGWVSGVVANGIKDGPRHYRISREALYPGTLERADLCVSRVEPTTGEAIGRPAYIEAKRAFRWTTHLTNIYQPNVTSLRGEIANDILKVRRLAMQSTSPAFRGYILVWNITDQEMKTKISPHDYLKPVVDEDFRVW